MQQEREYRSNKTIEELENRKRELYLKLQQEREELFRIS